MSLLDAARTALAEGDAPRALSSVAEYERQFPDGSLAPEAAVLRIEALAAMGADGDAIAAADRFLAAAPNSPHARRVRAIVVSIRDRRVNP
jgi:outer membrane protein assembly factor BamD (BamD/ComL family)